MKYSLIRFFSILLMYTLISTDITHAVVVLNGTQTSGSQYCGWLNIGNGPSPGAGYTVDTTFQISSQVNATQDQGIIGSTPSGFGLDLPGSHSLNRLDIFTGVSDPHIFYFPLNSDTGNTGSLSTGTTYRISVSISSGNVLRAWLNGKALSTSLGGSTYQINSVSYGGAAINSLGTFYSSAGAQSANRGFQGTIFDVGVSNLSSSAYPAQTDITANLNSYTTAIYNKLLVTPATALPAYASISGATASTTVDSNGYYQTTFTALNTFYAGESITLPNGTSGFLNGGTATVYSATYNQFVIETAAKVSGTWSGLGTAIQGGTFYDDAGAPALRVLAWPYQTACEAVGYAPTNATPSISGTVASGNTLTATLVGVTGTNTYQWESAATQSGTYASISGATAQTYTISTSDIGKYLKVIVTNNSIPYTSSPTGMVPKLTPTLTWAATSSTTYGSVINLDAAYQAGAFVISPSIPGSFTYSSASPLTVSESGVGTASQLTALLLGTSILTATFTPSDTSTYNAVSANQTISVGQATPTLAAIATLTPTYGTSSVTVTNPAITPGTLTGSFSYARTSGTSVGVITGNTINISSAGSSVITATFTPGSSNYKSTTETFTVNVGQATPALNPISNQSATYSPSGSTTTLSPSAVGSVAGTFSYVIPPSGSSVASISGNILTFKGAGQTTVTANFSPSSSNYTTNSETFTVTVGQATPTLSAISSPSVSYGTPSVVVANPTITPSSVTGSFAYSYTPVTGSSVSSISGNTLNLGGVGQTIVTSTFTPDPAFSANYASASETFTVSVIKATPTLTPLSNVSKNYGDAAFSITNPTVTPSLDGTFAYTTTGTSVSISGNQISLLSSGVSTVTATFTPSTANQASYSVASETFTVSVAASVVTFNWSDVSKTFGDSSFSLTTPTVLGGVAGSFTGFTSSDPLTASVSGSTVTIVKAGIVTITAHFAPSNTTLYMNSTISMTLTIGQKVPTLTWSDIYLVHGGSTQSITPPSSGLLAGTLSYVSHDTSIATISGSQVTPVGAGSTTITATFIPSDSNYQSNVITVNLYTQRATITPSWSTYSNTYGDGSYTITPPSVASGSQPASALAGIWSYSSANTGVISIIGSQVTVGSPGYSVVTASFAPTDSINFNPTSIQETFTVTKASTSLGTWNNVNQAYGASSYTLISPLASVPGTFTYTSSMPTVASVNSSTGVVTIGLAGSSTITATFAPTDSTDYLGSSRTMTFSVGAIAPTLSWPLIQKTFGDAPFTVTAPTGTPGTFTYTSQSPLIVSSSGTNGATMTILAKGSAQITANFTPSDTNDFTSVQITTTINVASATPSISVTPITSTFGSAPFHTSAASTTVPGVITYTSNDSTIIQTSGTNGETLTVTGAGSTTLTASFTPTDGFTYNASTAAVTVTISQASQAALVVVAASGKTNVPLALSTTGGSDSSTQPSYSTTDAGCSITTTGSSLSLSYFVTKTGDGGTCGVIATKAASRNYLVVTSVSASIQFAGEQATLVPPTYLQSAQINDTYTASATFSAGAAVVSVDSGSTGVCSITGGVVTFLAQGQCTLDYANPGNALYQAKLYTQTIVVNTASQTITFPAISNQLYLGNQVTASATSSAGLTISYSSTSDPRTCSITSSGVITIGALLGTCTITATQSGNLIYSAAPTVLVSFNVVATTPSAPRIASVTPWDTTVALTWAAPSSNGGAAITNYFVTTYQGETTTVQTCSSSAAGCTVTGLTNGTSYSFAVTATNSVGNSPASARTQVVTPAGKADAVHSLTLTPSTTVLSATWSQIDTTTMLNGGVFQNFNIYITTDPSNYGTPVVDTSTAATSHTFTGLTNGVTYYVQVITVTNANAVDILGETANSSYALPSAPSGPPTLSLTNTVAGAITANWIAPSSDGGSLLSYVVSASVNGISTPCLYTAPYSTCTITGLNAGDVVALSVTAVNAYGSSAAATSSATVLSVPAAPTVTSISSVDANHVQVNWSYGSNNGSALMWATIKAFTAHTSFEVAHCLVSAPATSCVLTLTSGNFYDFDYSVFATNALGDGPASAVFHLNVSAPAAPTGLSASVTDTSFTVSFTAGSNGNLPITNYQYSLDSGVNWTSFGSTPGPLVVTSHITQSTHYSLILRGVNAFGNGDTSTAVVFLTTATPVVTAPAPVVTPNPVVPVIPVTPVVTCDAACQSANALLVAKQLADQLLAAATKVAVTEAQTQTPTQQIVKDQTVSVVVSTTPIQVTSGGSGSALAATTPTNQDFVPPAAVTALAQKINFTSTVGTIAFTPAGSFTGRVVVPVVRYIADVPTTVLTDVVVNPAAVPTAGFRPATVSQSVISWVPPASDVTGYQVSINGVVACQTTSAACNVTALIGPNTKVSIQALGNDQTISAVSTVAYVPVAPVQVLASHFVTDSSKLAPSEIARLNSIAQVVKAQGFTRVVCVGHTDSTGTDAINIPLAKARAQAEAAYLSTVLSGVTITVKSDGSAHPRYSNNTASGRADNRSTDFLTW